MQMENQTAGTARARLAALFDEGVYQEFGARRLEKAQPAGVVTASGFVRGELICAFAQDPDIENGAVGPAQAEKVEKLFSLAAKTGVPVVGIYDSYGAFMDGSPAALDACSRMLACTSSLSGVVPQISIVAGTCVGSAAVMACAADVVLMTREATLSADFSKDKGDAESCAKAGLAARVTEDFSAALDLAKDLLDLLPHNNMAGVPFLEGAEALPEASGAATPEGIADKGSLRELFPDYAGASLTALATVERQTVGIAAAGKEGEPLTRDDFEKLSRFMRLCDAFSIPVITLINAAGPASPDAVRSLTRLAGSYAEATTGKIALVTGNAIGATFMALAGKGAGADFVFALEDACVAPLTPEAAVEFFWHDRLKGSQDLEKARETLAKEYRETLASANAAAECGLVDDVVTAGTARDAVLGALHCLESKRSVGLPRKHSNLPF